MSLPSPAVLKTIVKVGGGFFSGLFFSSVFSSNDTTDDTEPVQPAQPAQPTQISSPQEVNVSAVLRENNLRIVSDAAPQELNVSAALRENGLTIVSSNNKLDMEAAWRKVVGIKTAQTADYSSNGKTAQHIACDAVAQEFINLWQSGACDEVAQEKLDNILKSCELSGRMIHYFDKKKPDALSDKEWQRLSWTFGPDALSGFLGKNAREICVQLGFAEEWLIHQIAKGKKFKLSIFPSKEVDGKCATWDGLAYLLENHYSEVWPKISPHLPRIQETSFVDLEKEAGYDMWEANKAGRRQGAIDTEGESDDPNYISMQRLHVRAGTCVEVRQFLWDEIGLNKLFTGKGYTEDEQGNVGPKEYLAMNKRFVDIKGLCIVDVDPK